MKGTVYKRGSTWSYQFTLGSRKPGRTRKHYSRGGFTTKKACQAALTEALAKLGQGDDRVLVRPSDQPLGDYLIGWLDGRRASSSHALKGTTAASYANCISAWIEPHVGRVPLRDVTAATLIGLYQTLREKGSRCRRCRGVGRLSYQPSGGRCPACAGVGGRPLGDRSVVMAHTLLSMAFADAVEAGSLAVSPVERLPRRSRPSYTQRKQPDRTWSDVEARRFLAHVADERLYALWALALDTGARRGELAALRWPDVDLDAGVVRIARNRVHVGRDVVETTPKSKKPRTVGLDDRTVAALRAWQRQQKLERLAAGPAWVGGELDDAYLWTDEAGGVYRPDGLSDRFEAAQAGAGVPRLVLHGLRHTSATLALLAGVQVHVVSQRLGHANVSITLDTYSHVLPQQDGDAARLIGGAIYGAEVGS